jgi:replicative DNA helicase
MAIEYINGANEKYPEQLLEGRELTEGNCVGLLWRYMYLVDIYDDLKEEDFITVDGRLYFKIIKEMKKAGYEIIDAVNVATFMKDRPTLNEIFESNEPTKS